MNKIRYIGMDVHGQTIALAYADEGREEPHYVGQIPNRPEALRRILEKVRVPGISLKVCYEAGPCGYGLYWELCKLEIECEVIAPSLVPQKTGDRVKTDKRDACKLARSYRSGELTPVFVPGPEHEALRELVRAREAAQAQQRAAKQRVKMFLLRQGVAVPYGVNAWTKAYQKFLNELCFEQKATRLVWADLLAELAHHGHRVERLEQEIAECLPTMPKDMQELVSALCCFRGIKTLTAAILVTELGELERFRTARQLMGYSGLVPSEHSSGGSIRRGGITKTGNAHLRRILVETAWTYRMPPRLSAALKKRQQGKDARTVEMAWKAQHRLYKRYHRLVSKGKPAQKVVAAVARELCGFLWAVGRKTGRQLPQTAPLR